MIHAGKVVSGECSISLDSTLKDTSLTTSDFLTLGSLQINFCDVQRKISRLPSSFSSVPSVLVQFVVTSIPCVKFSFFAGISFHLEADHSSLTSPNIWRTTRLQTTSRLLFGVVQTKSFQWHESPHSARTHQGSGTLILRHTKHTPRKNPALSKSWTSPLSTTGTLPSLQIQKFPTASGMTNLAHFPSQSANSVRLHN